MTEKGGEGDLSFITLSSQVPVFSALRFTQHVSPKPFKVLYNLFDSEDLINIIVSQLSRHPAKRKTTTQKLIQISGLKSPKAVEGDA